MLVPLRLAVDVGAGEAACPPPLEQAASRVAAAAAAAIAAASLLLVLIPSPLILRSAYALVIRHPMRNRFQRQ
jgi:hypothetical protein